MFLGLYFLFSSIKLDDATQTQSVFEAQKNIDIKNIPPINFKLKWQNTKDNSKSVLGFITDLFRFNTIRKQFYQTLRTHRELVNIFNSHSIYTTVQLKNTNDILNKKIYELHQIINDKQNLIDKKINEINAINEKELLNLTGFLSPLYNLGNSERYKEKLELIQFQQKEQIKDDSAITLGTDWVLGNDKKAGQKMMKDISKLILRSFNNECDTLISKVKYSNFDSVYNRIQKSFESVNKLSNMLHISIKRDFFNLKVKELYLVHEYENQKQLEKEAAVLERERLKEEAKLKQEVEREKAINEKEKQHFLNRQKELMDKLKNSYFLPDDQKIKIQRDLNEINQKIVICEKKNEDLDFRINKASAGYVYIISNIGSFGENVYKIGVTRRLDPQDRIDELASASVPFRFDVHSVIFSENAFKLEKDLHQAFDKKRVNLVNNRKEFFKLDLKDLNQVLKTKTNKHFELKYEADATDFRESERLRKL